ncbi:hypothetical protein V8C37DRAFT_392754 [Trichoderma ceciliae]
MAALIPLSVRPISLILPLARVVARYVCSERREQSPRRRINLLVSLPQRGRQIAHIMLVRKAYGNAIAAPSLAVFEILTKVLLQFYHKPPLSLPGRSCREAFDVSLASGRHVAWEPGGLVRKAWRPAMSSLPCNLTMTTVVNGNESPYGSCC